MRIVKIYLLTCIYGGDTKILNEILETVIFLKDNAVTKDELEETKVEKLEKRR